MIEIIQRGTKNKCTCANCGCIFSYEEEDIKHDGAYSMDVLRTRKSYINCPQCNKEITLVATR